MFLLSTNKKLKKDHIFKFSLPAILTCPKAGLCKSFCYAQRGCFRFPKPKASQARALELTRTNDFVSEMISEIKRRRTIRIIRIHDSGDFYNQGYLNKWIDIIQACPDNTFYCYTKSLHLNWSAFDKLPNTKRIQSFGGLMDDQIDLSKPHAVIFDTHEELIKAGYIDCSLSDMTALITESVHIGLVKH